MKKKLLIYGAGGLGREIAAMLREMPEWEIEGFVDDSLKVGASVGGFPVVGNRSFLHSVPGGTCVIVALGDPGLKAVVVNSLKELKIEFPVLIHPSATLLDRDSIRIGRGSVICAGAVLTTDILLGEHVLVNLNATIGHDNTIGDFSSVMPGVNIAGQVRVGERVLIGSGCSVRNRVRIGRNATLGMGSVVISDVEEDSVVAGVPARPISR